MTNAALTFLLVLVYLAKSAVALAAAVGAGGQVLARLRGEKPFVWSPALDLAVCAVLGLGLLGAVMVVTGLAGIWHPVWVGALVLACAAGGAWRMWGDRKSWRSQRQEAQTSLPKAATTASDAPRWLLWLIGLLCAAAALNTLLGALAPDAQQDSLWYHLSCARAWIWWGRLDAWPEVFPSNYALHGSVLYSIALMLGDEIDCSLLYALEGFLCFSVAALFARRWFGAVAGAWTWLLCATAYGANVWFVPINTGAELTVAMFATAGLLVAVEAGFGAGEARRNAALWMLSGVLTGFAVATKITALGYGLAPWLVLLAVAVVRRRVGWKMAAGAVALACLPFALWAVRSATLGSGNPFFPMFREWMPMNESFSAAVAAAGAGGGGGRLDIHAFSPAGALEALRAVPDKLNFAVAERSPGFVLHAAVVLALFAVRDARLRALGAVALVQWVVYIWTAGQSETIKYFAMCYPAVFVAVGAGMAWLGARREVSPTLRYGGLAAVAAALAWTYGSKQVQWGGYETVAWGYRPVLTAEDRLSYLETKPFGLDLIRQYDELNRTLPRDAVVQFVSPTYPFYLNRRFYWRDPIEAEGGVQIKPGVTHVIENGVVRELLTANGRE
ncbi:hypothetical protein CVU37_04560 [candidate division BRC1 bacterium HGW-BRC1-1]|jgi:hypothetical protein|nr:MAG: hypothetical protein CVU37_04560 [candidate division BRC1 bacterium HGW-BRC1-1]